MYSVRDLIENAIKFTTKNGRVGLEITGDKDEYTLNLTIGDTGIGIASDDIKRLFQPFTQLDSRLACEDQGVGLGLSCVRQYAKMHVGSTLVEGEVGKGSRFTVSLPWSPVVEMNELDTICHKQRRFSAIIQQNDCGRRIS